MITTFRKIYYDKKNFTIHNIADFLEQIIVWAKENIKQVDYDAVTSWHVHYKNAYEIEFGITLPN